LVRRSTAGVRKDEDGVSEVVGYVIIAGIILTSISIAYVNGYPALQDVRDHERQRSVQSAFSVLDDNMNAISTGGSVKRQTEMNLIGDSLGLDPDRRGWIHVSIVNSTTGDELCNRGCNVSYTPIVYQNSAQGLTNPRAPGPSGSQVNVDRIVYENGAVIRDPGGNGSGMVNEPNWIVREDGVVINILSTRGSGTVVGEGTFSVISEERSTDSLVEVDSDSELDVAVTVGTQTPTAWELYMNSTDGVNRVESDMSDGTVTMYVNDTQKAIRSKTVVDAEVR
jgi:hypothetical protein